ncbi:HAD family hydrolase [uncultured Rubinisphaera sp.]|uniref:HAD family hydrolase n=1 Tax=uncultured Rubinisphaera sp. TaxID=1678686 RepID=UPI0030D7E670
MKALLTVLFLFTSCVCHAEEILPSWNEGAARDAIIDFVECSTKDGCTKYIEPKDRIAVFDNDGTLWSEQPVYFQLMFAIDRVKEMAKDHPEWKSEQPFQAVLENDLAALKSSGKEGLMKIMAVTHAGMSTDEFAVIVHEWITTAKHPQKNRLYKEMVFQPMLELLQYLRENGFKTYIFSGGGIEFMRVFAEEVYGIPPEQVIGSSIVTKYELHDGVPVLIRQPKIDFIDDKEGKPISINKFLGKRPVAAFGNSDGDLQMLQWTTAGEGARFGLIVHHTDSEREWAYDRESPIGQLDKAFTEAKAKGWTIVDMKQDWKTIYPEK